MSEAEREGPEQAAPFELAAARPSLRLRIGVSAAVVLVLVAVAVAVLTGMLSPAASVSQLGAAGAPPPATQFTARPSAPASPASVIVHVLGAVAGPGVYELPKGARVLDAVAAAGGLGPDADPAGLNLARLVADGEQITVPHLGEAPVAAPGSGPAPAEGAARTASAPIDLNTATQEQLEELPRVGPETAQRIIAWREANGGFSSVDDLLEVTGIGQKTFDGLRELVTV